jgi:hypothetical protein
LVGVKKTRYVFAVVLLPIISCTTAPLKQGVMETEHATILWEGCSDYLAEHITEVVDRKIIAIGNDVGMKVDGFHATIFVVESLYEIDQLCGWPPQKYACYNKNINIVFISSEIYHDSLLSHEIAEIFLSMHPEYSKISKVQRDEMAFEIERRR